MAGFLETIKSSAKQAATWAIGRGAVTTAVAASAYFLGPGALSVIPWVVVPIAMGFSSFSTQLAHGVREKKIVGEYCHEIGASLDVEPKNVTVEHLYFLAGGNKRLEIPPNKILQEELDNNDQSRMVNIASHIFAGVMAIGLILTMMDPSGVGAGFIENFMGGSSDLAKGLAISGATGTVSFVLDKSLSYFGKSLMGVNDKSSYDRIKDITRIKGRGRDVSVEQVFDLFVHSNDSLADAIKSSHQADYAHLPPPEQRRIAKSYESEFHVIEITQLINEGRMDPHELAFSTQGTNSGVPVKTAEEMEVKSAKESLEQAKSIEPMIGKQDGVVMQAFMKPVTKYMVVKNPATAESLMDQFNHRFGEAKQSFVEKYAPHGIAKQKTYVERITKEKVGDKTDAKELFVDVAHTVASEALGNAI